ncbi:pimeloyl-ACP methyl ester carboxylesterase [Nocardiopsis sp. Huas11]|uniref:alpha/beta fold hydrolase n=1 Tax=Nocardiopsis sp. Huas11 TaxID=2183912 RepID=UPI000EB159AB|nr:alpha/beta hydrolase [Nocardiopsis sp. Huas11]RKS07093.1 pimeloyl-ACP methyl ester carboxylesterase [Nocardiopsis sp. Huas11]
MTEVLTDAALARSLEGDFTSHQAQVNGTRLHYVEGGQGDPLILLGGWPQTWWQFHKIMPELARGHRVIAVDLRGMGGSAKPDTGYDKRTMARDIAELAHSLGLEKVSVAGHDIGAMVAQSLAANHPGLVDRLVLLDVHHPDESMYGLTLIPSPDQHVDGDFTAGSRIYLWWFALNQVQGLPETLLVGREREWIDALFDYMLLDGGSIGEREREIYARAYSSPEAIRAGNGWYRSFMRDIEDEKHHAPLTMPVLALGGDHSNHDYLAAVLPAKGVDVRVVEVKDSGHYLPEEQPEVVIRHLTGFLA